MEERTSKVELAQFGEWVRDALNHLYNSAHLQNHPLIDLLATPADDTLHRSQILRRILLQTIQELRPGAGTPAQSSDWRAYRILALRYIESLSPQEVMEQINLSKSHYYREQARVLDAFIAVLWDRFCAAGRQQDNAAPLAGEEVNRSRKDLALAEVERLRANAVWQEVDVTQLVLDLRRVVEPLAQIKHVTIQYDLQPALCVLHADPTLLRQTVLNTLTFGLDFAQQGTLTVGSFQERGEEGIAVVARRGDLPRGGDDRSLPELPRHGIGLEIGRQMMALMQGTLRLFSATQQWEARLCWPVAEAPALLVIDDNDHFISLFRRYLSGSRWQVVGATSGSEARRLLAQIHPTVIILDVMMPHEDGWEVLKALRTDAQTAEIPVVICSVLNEPQLALTLGSSAYLSKPVSQQRLLQTLSRWQPTAASPAPNC